MRIPCPHCGPRDSREFTYLGAATLMERPDSGLHDYVHLRDNPAGDHAELWQHRGCRAWLRVVRNVSSHKVISAELASGGTP